MDTSYRAPLAFSGQSLATSVTSSIIDIRPFNCVAIQPIATGATIAGSIQMQASANGVTFGAYGSAIDLTSSNLIPVNLPDLGFGYVQFVFTAASGVGSLTLYVSGK